MSAYPGVGTGVWAVQLKRLEDVLGRREGCHWLGEGVLVVRVTSGASRRIHRPGPLSAGVVDSLLDRIVGGEFGEGTGLPSEPALCVEYGVSRTVIRDALRVLVEKGVVRVIHGRGSVVCPEREWPALDAELLALRLEHDGWFEVFEELTMLRILIECYIAGAAARRVTAEGCDELKSLLGEMEAAVDRPADYLEVDLAFHNYLAAMSGNQLLGAILGTVSDALRSSRRVTNRIPGGVRRAQEDHVAIATCVCEGDESGAGAKMRAHLEWALERAREMVSEAAPMGGGCLRAVVR